MKIHEIVANNFNAIFEPKIQKELCDYGILKHAQPDQYQKPHKSTPSKNHKFPA